MSANTQVKVSGAWTDLLVPHGKVGGSWVEGHRLFAKKSGAWELVWSAIPKDVLINYTASSYAPPGATTWADLDSIYLRIYYPVSYSYTAGTKGGASSHSASVHGASGQVTWSNNAGMQRLKDRSLGTSPEYAETSSLNHDHTGSPISWSLVTNGQHKKPCVQYPARLGGYYIPAEAIFMHLGTQSWAKWTRYTSYDGYYVGAGSNSTISSQTTDYSSHSHGTWTGYTGYFYNNDSDKCSAYTGYSYYNRHRHRCQISAATASASYKYQYVVMYKMTSQATWEELPSGTICVHIGSSAASIPPGWSEWSTPNGYALYATTSATSKGGSWAHSHSKSTTWNTQDYTTTWNVQTGTDNLWAGHTQSHSYSTTGSFSSANVYPHYIYVHLIKKD